jgi:hypothetical protein
MWNGSNIRIDSDQFDRLLRDGKLYRLRGRKAEEHVRHSREAASALWLSEDQHTTRREKGESLHRFTNDNGTVIEYHPYSKDVKALTR